MYGVSSNFRDIHKIFVVYDMVYRVKSDMSETDIGMPVFCGSRNIFTVINVKDGNLIFSDQAVELIDHIIEMVDDIISAVTCMTSVKADSLIYHSGQLHHKVRASSYKIPSVFLIPFRPLFQGQYSSQSQQ